MGYTVPQKIDTGKIGKFAEVFFRVRSVLNNAEISVKAGEEILFSKKREQMLPAEMEKLIIPKKVFDAANGRTITVSAEEAEK